MMIELPPINLGEIDGSTARLMREYARQAVAAAMERAAQIAEQMKSGDTDWDTSYWNQCADRIAFAIRAEMSKAPT